MTKQYIYSLYDAKTGALRAKGTPQELMEQGYYNRAESVCTGYAHQKKKKAKPKKWRLEREEKQPKPKAEPDHRTGTQMREVWLYSMFDADGNLLHEGAAAERGECDDELGDDHAVGRGRRELRHVLPTVEAAQHAYHLAHGQKKSVLEM